MQLLILLLLFYLPNTSFAKPVTDNLQSNNTQRVAQPDPVQNELPAEKHYIVVGEISGGVNSNPSYSESLAYDTEWDLRAFASYRFIATRNFESSVRYSFQNTYYQNNSASEFGSHLLYLPSAYYFGKIRVEVAPLVSIDSFNNKLFSRNIGASVSFTQKLERSYLGASYRAQRINIPGEEYAYYQGLSHQAEIFYRLLGDDTETRVGVDLQKYVLEDTDNIAASHYRVGPNFSWARNWGDWDLRTALSLEFRFYRRAANENATRRDKSALVFVETGLTLNRQMRVFSQIQFIRNLSNFDQIGTNYTYSQGRAMLGLSFGI